VPGKYSLNLFVHLINDSVYQDRTYFIIDHNRPVFTKISYSERLKKNDWRMVVEWNTDDKTTGSVYGGLLGSSNSKSLDFNYHTDQHHNDITPLINKGVHEFYIIAQNDAGLVSVSEIDTTTINNYGKIDSYNLKNKFTLPAGSLLSRTFDSDNNGKNEIIIMNDSKTSSYGTISFYELSGDTLVETYQSDSTTLPESIFDLDNDNKNELISITYPHSYLFESPTPNTYPSIIVKKFDNLLYRASTDMRIDIDKDNNPELIFVNTSDNSIVIYEVTSDNTYQLRSTIPNPEVKNSNWGNIIIIEDITGDGYPNVITMNTSKNYIYIIDFIGSFLNPKIITVDSLPMEEVTYITSGYGLDSNATAPLLVVGLVDNIDIRNAYWQIQLLKYNASNMEFNKIWDLEFYDYGTSKIGATIADFDSDNRNDIIMGFSPNLYVIKNNGNYKFTPFWWRKIDFAVNEPFSGYGDLSALFGYRAFDNIYLMEKPGANILSQISLNISLLPLNADSLKITWDTLTTKGPYYIYRGTSSDSLNLYRSGVMGNSFKDSVITNQVYWYAVADTDSSSSLESISGFAHNPYSIDSAWTHANLKQVWVKFDTIMSGSVNNPANYHLSNGLTPSSVTAFHKNSLTLLSFDELLMENSIFTLTVSGIFDFTGMPLDPNGSSFNFKTSFKEDPIHLVRAQFENKDSLTLYFSHPLSNINFSDSTFHINNNIIINNIIRNPDSTITLSLDSSTQLNLALNNYTVKIDSLSFIMKDSSNTVAYDLEAEIIIGVITHLGDVITYPNPYKWNKYKDRIITFKNVTDQLELRIYSMNGDLVRHLDKENTNGFTNWDLKNEQGEYISSGMYIYYITSSGDSKKGKITVVK